MRRKQRLVRRRSIELTRLARCALVASVTPRRTRSHPRLRRRRRAAGRRRRADATPAASFDDWLAGVRAEALTKGISAGDARRGLRRASQPDPVVIARDRTQPELTQSLDDYVAARLSPKTLATRGRGRRADKALARARRRPPTASRARSWSRSGASSRTSASSPASRPVITRARHARLRRPAAGALPRASCFEALAIVDRGPGHVSASSSGSWAGAMGQPQFMPSSFLKYAVDFDGDGKIDIWTSPADVLGSMAELPQDRRLDRGRALGPRGQDLAGP